MTTGILHDQNLEQQMEKHIGCMAGFRQLFDRHQILTGKRLYTTKRLTPSSANDSASQSEKSFGSPAFSGELLQQPQQHISRSPPECMKPSPSPSPSPDIRSAAGIASPLESSARMPLPLPVFEFKESLRSSWKFKEAPRLSLDSRAMVDAKGSLYPREIRARATVLSRSRWEKTAEGTAPAEENNKQGRSPSVIAKLMGLQALPDSGREPIKKVELRRSASESRVSRDLQYRYIDGSNFLLKQPEQSNYGSNDSRKRRDNPVFEDHKSKAVAPDFIEHCVRKPTFTPQNTSISPWKSHQQRKSFFYSEDFFPEPKQTGSLYGEIEKRLKMRGIDEPAKDLETLKQILEALQLKGLLHSKRLSEQIGNRNVVFDRKFSSEESPIVLMKPSKSPVLISRNGRIGVESPSNLRSKSGINRKLNHSGENPPPMKQRRDRREIDQNLQRERKVMNSRSSDRNESTEKSPRSLARREPLNIETQRRENGCVEQRRISPIHSPKISSKKAVSDQSTNRLVGRRKSTTEFSPKERFSVSAEDESSTFSECSVSTSSQIDTERSKGEDYKEAGRSLLERCDKLLHSIAEFTTSTTESQPSPISVLDSSLLKDESSPSPVRKRCIDFKDRLVELECENWSPVKSRDHSKFQENSDECDFLYVKEILRTSNCLSEDVEETDVFLLLEKQHLKINSSKVSRLHRKLVFDTIIEIIDRKGQIPSWKTFLGTTSVIGKPTLGQIWSEFQRIQEIDPAEDLFEVICGVLRKDMTGDAINGWVETRLETSEAVLDIERLIFKDLIGETIRDLAAFSRNIKSLAPKRKLVF